MEIPVPRGRQARSVDAFMLSDRRNTNAAYRFLRKAIKAMSRYPPSSITTDKLASYPRAILRLQNEGLLPNDVVHRTSKYLNTSLRRIMARSSA